MSPSRTQLDGSRLERVSQTTETPVTSAKWGASWYRYAYTRATQSRDIQDPGQDYLVIRNDRRKFAVALCDGVSQSYFGGIAARFLGDRLIDWLWDLENPGDQRAVTSALNAYLRELTLAASDEIEFPARAGESELSPMMRDVLEETRSGGSESMFVGGRLELPSPALPNGLVLVTWMGDSRLRLWGTSGELHVTSTNTSERWSTRAGPIGGSPHVLVQPLAEQGEPRLSRFVVYSDGFAALDELAELPGPGLEELLEAASKDPDSDDISFIDVRVTVDLSTRQQTESPTSSEAMVAAPQEAPISIPRRRASVLRNAILLASLAVLVIMGGLVLAPVSPGPGLHLRERVLWLVTAGRVNSAMPTPTVTPTPGGG